MKISIELDKVNMVVSLLSDYMYDKGCQMLSHKNLYGDYEEGVYKTLEEEYNEIKDMIEYLKRVIK